MEKHLGMGDIHHSNIGRDSFGLTRVLLEHKDPLYNLGGLVEEVTFFIEKIKGSTKGNLILIVRIFGKRIKV